MNPLAHIFSFVCGQLHCWAPGGSIMPVCERCLGLYLGVLWSLALILGLRPAASRAMVWMHGMAMLIMFPFGYHFVPQGAILRTGTGFLFGIGMIYYLAIVPADVFRLERFAKDRSAISYSFVAVIPLPWILLTAKYGSTLAGSILALMAVAGLALTVLLTLANAAALACTLIARRQRATA